MKMRIVDLIEKKKQGKILSKEEISFIITSLMNESAPDYQISAFLMAIYFQGLTKEETAYLTEAMINSGETIDFESLADKLVDKHSTGGVGDKVTITLIPLLAAAGIPVAKLSGRGLGHTGGTIDKLESIPGFNTQLSISELIQQVKKINVAIGAQTQNLTPADGKLYALRDVTSTVDIIPLIASSVVSKKIASGANHIILDVKYGSGAFLKTPEEAQKLSEIMVEVGKRLNRNICAVISSMDQPLGRAVGNSVEIQEVIEFLKGNMEPDLKEITYTLLNKAFEKTGKFSTKEESYNYLDELISSGKALEKFREIVDSQNGNSEVLDDYTKLPQASIKYEVKSNKDGFVKNIDALKIAKACKNLGAGREKKSDSIDYSAGIYLTQKYSEPVKEGETIAVIYTNKQEAIKDAEMLIKEAFDIAEDEQKEISLIYKIIN